VTAHELIENDKIKELHFASGGPLGGIKVDEAFVDLMKDIFGKDFIDSFKKESASQWLQIICDFEKRKDLSNKMDHLI
jgi:hypothetical protein